MGEAGLCGGVEGEVCSIDPDSPKPPLPRNTAGSHPLIRGYNRMFIVREGVHAQMMELADMHASGACVARRGGSNPPLGR